MGDRASEVDLDDDASEIEQQGVSARFVHST